MRPIPTPNDLPDVVVIPYWVRETLKRNNLDIKECLNYEKLKNILAMEDLVCFHNSQKLLPLFTGVSDNMPTGYPLTAFALYDQWLGGISDTDTALKEELRRNVLDLSHSVGTDTTSRLFGTDNIDPRYDVPFEVMDLDRKLIGLIIYPGHFNHAVELSLQYRLVDALLKVFYVYLPYQYHRVARSPLFLRKLELLSGGHAM